MTRVKPGTNTRRRHKKILKMARGYRMTRHKQFKKAQEAILHAGEYAFAGRKKKKRDFRKLWIVKINAAIKPLGLKYSQFINLLKNKKIAIDRKILAKVAFEFPQVFKKIVNEVK